MKKLLFILAIMSVAFTNEIYAQSYTYADNTYTQVASKGRTATPPTKTPFTYKDSKGKSYTIYLNSNGRAFVLKTSQKTGKEYRYYLKDDVSMDICKKMNITFVPRKKETK